MSKRLLEEIRSWKAEAKLEDSERYFFHIDEVDKILSGESSYVIGRKGTGKTAISEYLNKISEPKKFSQKLTFKNFPFNALYELDNDSYTSPNQYITIWKYVIYSSLAKLFIKNENIDLSTRSKLESIYTEDLSRALSRAVKKWTSKTFSLKVLGSGISVGGEKDQDANELSWIDKVDILEDFIASNIDDCTYLIIFDELDEDYKDIIAPEKHKRYTQLLTSLFKAVQDIRSIFSDKKLYPVILLRDDIYDVLGDPDKTKWDDLKISLNWSEDLIKNLLSFRLGRAHDPKGESFTYQKSWNNAFKTGDVRYGNKKSKRMRQFDYISRSTHLRPRDFVKYIQLCAKKALEKKQEKISPSIISQVNNEFSAYLRSEIEDEISGVVPEIHDILDIFARLRKQTLKISEFTEEYERAIKDGELPRRDAVFVLNVLYIFSVIGGQPNQKTFQVFRYYNPGTSLNMNDNIIVHRGLYRSLQIL